MNAITLLVGLAAGAASAALSTALASGSLFSLFLFCFAPLPIFIAALGWRHHAGLIGAIAGTAILHGLLGFGTARGFALSVGLPGWWLAYLSLLGQPADPDKPELGFAWFPVGRLVTWAAFIGAALVIATLLLHGGSVDDYRATLRSTFEMFLRAETGTAADAPVTLPGGQDAAQLIEMAVVALPPLAAALWTAIALTNLWVGGRVVRASGRLPRPWPDLSAFNLPPLALIALTGGIIATAFPGLFGFSAGVIAASFIIAFTALGLAFLHAATRGTGGRTIMLAAAYFLMAIQTWLVVLIAALGVIEFLFGIRARMRAARPPAPPR